MRGVVFAVVFAVFCGLVYVVGSSNQTTAPTALDPAAGDPPSPAPPEALRSVAELERSSEGSARAELLFAEVGKVLTHARCVNCHPKGDRPLQGEAGALHQPLVVRGPGGTGAPGGLLCITCHGTETFGRVPGNAKWLLAPPELAWEGASLHEICVGLKAFLAERGDAPAALVEFVETDSLVAYGFAPPAHLAEAPGSPKALAALVTAWVEAGADCPPPAVARTD